jgi:hypothetical protein
VNNVGWHIAPECPATLYTAEEATQNLRPDEELVYPFVLLIGNTNCAGLAIEGTREQLQDLAEYILAATKAEENKGNEQ